MDALTTDLGEDDQRGQRPALEIHDSHPAAPSLLCDIHRAAADHRPSPETEQALQAEARKLAQQVLAHLPTSERQALTERIIHMQRATPT